MECISADKPYQSSIGTRIKEKFPWIPELIYLSSLFIYISAQFIQGTMLSHKLFIASIAYHAQMFVALVVVIKALLFDEHSLKDWILLFLLGTVLWSSGTNAVLLDIFYYYIFIVAAKNVDFSNIAKVFLFTITTGLFITFILAKTGIIRGLAYSRPNGAMRYALGTIYPSDLAARCFCLMLAYVIVKNFKLCLPEYIGLIALTATTYVVTDTKVDLILMALLVLASIFHEKFVSILEFLTSRGIALILGTAVCAMILATYFYTPNNHILLSLNNALSGRLYFSHMAFDKYNMTMLGQYIEQRGFGGETNTVINYFYIDSSYIRVLMMFGAIVFVILVAYLLYLSYTFMNTRNYTLEIALIFIALSALIDQHMWELSFNIVFLATFADLGNFGSSKRKFSIAKI